MPPPLDEVWLSEGERRQRHTQLDKQRQRNQKHQREVASKTIQEKLKITQEDDDTMPPLLGRYVSERDSGDESSVDSGESRSYLNSDSEGDDANMWADHPTNRTSDENSNRNSTRNSSQNLPGGLPDYLPENSPASVPSPTTNPSSGNLPTVPPTSPTTPPINHPGAPVPPEPPDHLGRGINGKSRRLKK